MLAVFAEHGASTSLGFLSRFRDHASRKPSSSRHVALLEGPTLHTRSRRRTPLAARLPQAAQAGAATPPAAAAAAQAPTEIQEAPQQAHVAPFEWKSNWYAVASSKDLDPSRPHPLMILGQRIVLWRDPKLQEELEEQQEQKKQEKLKSSSSDSSSSGSRSSSSSSPEGSSSGSRSSSSSSPEGSSSGSSNPEGSLSPLPAWPTAWRCFLDQCPHRLVPLSEGRIDDAGLLQCSYHGWTFAGDGSCRGIPQAAEAGPERSAIKSPRACAKPFPVMERMGILFVWPDASPEGALRAAATAPPFPVGVDESYQLSAFSREVQYGFDMLAENVMDPSHLPFAHHGVGPLNRKNAEPYPHASVLSEREGVQGFVGRLQEPAFKSFSPVQFQAPGLFAYYRSLRNRPSSKGSTGTTADSAQNTPGAPGALKELLFSEVEAGRGGEVLLTALFITPVAPGRSRLTTLEGSNRPRTGLFKFMSQFRFIGHIFLQQVLDGDAYFLHAQEKAVQAIQADMLPQTKTSRQQPDTQDLKANGSTQNGSSSNGNGFLESAPSLVSRAYFLPTSADRFVIGFRRWLDRFGGGGVDWPAELKGRPLPPDWTPKPQVLDRYEGHTASCTTCQQALSGFRTAQRVLFALAVVALMLAAGLNVGMGKRAVVALAGGLMAAVGAKLQQVIGLFIYTGYDHATK